MCSACHPMTPPSILPRRHWKPKIEKMYALPGFREHAPDVPMESVIDYFRFGAPPNVELPQSKAHIGPGSLRLRRRKIRSRDAPSNPGVSAVHFVDLSRSGKRELVLADMRHGFITVHALNEPADQGRVIARLRAPADIDSIDLDQDGGVDLLVAELGAFDKTATDQGRVTWLRRAGAGFDAITLLDGLPRVAAVRAADLDGDGDIDLVAAIAGDVSSGRLILMTNDGKQKFTEHTLDPRAGWNSLVIADLNGDGKPDIVAAIGQHYEEVVTFLSGGKVAFEKHVIYRAPHPDWGIIGIDAADLDQDGDIDVAIVNGDVIDTAIAKPYHAVRWMENRGENVYLQHDLTALPGARGVRIADLDGDGDNDIVASVFVPAPAKLRHRGRHESLIWLEQSDKGRFARHSIEAVTTYHAAVDVADFDGDGDVDIAAGNFTLGPTMADGVVHSAFVFENTRR